MKVNLQAQEESLQEEIEKQKNSFARIEKSVTEKDEQISKKNVQIESMQEEIDRRKYLEKKVQTYVRCLCQQNQRCKEFIQENFEDDDGMIEQFLESLKLDNMETSTEAV